MRFLIFLIPLLLFNTDNVQGANGKSSSFLIAEKIVVQNERQTQLLTTRSGAGVETIPANTTLQAISMLLPNLEPAAVDPFRGA